jgi:hypothetical protein
VAKLKWRCQQRRMSKELLPTPSVSYENIHMHIKKFDIAYIENNNKKKLNGFESIK